MLQHCDCFDTRLFNLMVYMRLGRRLRDSRVITCAAVTAPINCDAIVSRGILPLRVRIEIAGCLSEFAAPMPTNAQLCLRAPTVNMNPSPPFFSLAVRVIFSYRDNEIFMLVNVLRSAVYLIPNAPESQAVQHDERTSSIL